MCGIFGIIAPSRAVSEDLLRRAAGTLRHRGPDDSGTVIIDTGGSSSAGIRLGLAHTRLSIIDLSPLGHQPMHDPINQNLIVYNGEIYNYKQLRKELEGAGVLFNSHSDTEVILAAYRAWGDSCVTRLDGMFAFALWDAGRNRLILARDPMGIKPLYYHQSEQKVIFASEVRTLLGTGLVPKKIDSTGLLSFLEFGSVSEPWTMVEGVRAVPPGHTITFENGSLSSREYWNPLRPFHGASDTASRNGGSSEENLSVILRNAVLSHLVSDVPVGVFLSGGIDSSALVAVLSNNGVRASTFSLVFREEEYNEAQFSREVARHFGTEHHEIAVAERDTLAVLPDALRAMDQPTIDGINTYIVSAKTRAAGVKVALSGLGADEMFAGYSNFRRIPRMEKFVRRFGRLPRFAHKPLAASVAFLVGKNDRNRKLVDMTRGESAAIHPYFLARALFGASDCEALVTDADYRLAQQSLNRVQQSAVTEADSLDPVNRVAYFESIFYMRNTLLRDSDFMSMAHGLELRVPFLDRSLVEACFRIPGDRKIQGRVPKGLLLKSLGVELPKEIVNRPKRGFTFPFERWLRGEMRPLVEDALLNGNWAQTTVTPGAVREVWNRFLSGGTSWSRPWSLFVLQGWCEHNL